MYWPIEKLKPWAKNPRKISSDDYELLKKKIKRWGQFKPLLVTEEGIVLGGNMRLRAFKELGIMEVWVSVVKPKNEAEMVEIALTDNEMAGRTDEGKLQDLIRELPGIELGDYKVDLGSPVSLEKLAEGYKPVDLPGARESVMEREMVCPHCGQKIFMIV
jgi:hypothetical protein